MEQDLTKFDVSDLAWLVIRDYGSRGQKIYFGAVPYLDAMRSMTSIDDNYGADSGRTIISYFLSNASYLRGDVVKAVKKELNRRLKARG